MRERRSDLGPGRVVTLPDAGGTVDIIGAFGPRVASGARVVAVTAPAGSGKDRFTGRLLAEAGDWARLDLEISDGSGEPGPAGVRLPDATAQWLGAAARERPLLAVTNVQVLPSGRLLALIDEILDRLPPRVRLVLTGSGAGLPAPAVVRLGGDLVEVRARDLWVGPEEVAAVTERLTGVRVDPGTAERLHHLTGGWPAGLAILGRAVRSRPGALLVPDVTADPEILDFVAAEILDRLEPELREFVVRTAVLERLTPGTCAALRQGEPETQDGRAGASRLLPQVHRWGLTAAVWPPIASLPPAEGEVVCHPLVRAAALRVLRGRPSREPGAGGSVEEALRCAADHARRSGQAVEAAGYLAGAGEWERMLEVLAVEAATGFAGWEPARLAGVLRRLPEQAGPERRLLVASAAAIAGDQLTAAAVLRTADPDERQRVPWWPALALTVTALAAGTGRQAYRSSCSVLVELEGLDRAVRAPAVLGIGDRPSLTALAHLLAARAAVFDADLAAARRHLEARPAAAQVPPWCVLAGLGTEALVAVTAGDLAAAHRRLRRARDLAAQTGLAGHPLGSTVVLAGAELLRAQGRYAQALAELTADLPALRAAEAFVATPGGGHVHSTAAEVLGSALHLDLGEVETARQRLYRLSSEGDDDLPVALAAALAVVRARLHLMDGEVTVAERELVHAPAGSEVAAMRVRAALQRQATDVAETLLESWPFEEGLLGRLRRLLAGAGVALARDRRSEAAELVDEALVVAEPDGHVHVFLEAPVRVRTLVGAVLGRSLSSGWRQELAGALTRGRSPAVEADRTSLTPRELAVLERLTSDLTHAQIAAELFVSENTLKSHCRNLYRKLGVGTRVDAVRVARSRGWVAGAQGSASPVGDVVPGANITLEPEVAHL